MLKFSGFAHLASRLEHKASWLAVRGIVFALHSTYNVLPPPARPKKPTCIVVHQICNRAALTHNRVNPFMRGTPQCERIGVHTEAGMLSGMPNSTRCIQVPADSRNSAIHTAYHTLLRLSSVIEPGDPLPKLASEVAGCTPRQPTQ